MVMFFDKLDLLSANYLINVILITNESYSIFDFRRKIFLLHLDQFHLNHPFCRSDNPTDVNISSFHLPFLSVNHLWNGRNNQDDIYITITFFKESFLFTQLSKSWMSSKIKLLRSHTAFYQNLFNNSTH